MKVARMFFAVAFIVGVGQVVKGHDGHDHSKEGPQLTQREQLRVAVQGICPVSGEKLGAHGAPIKVTLGAQKQEVYYCCQGCLNQKIDPQHWATIHANFASAQRICPVMEKPIPKNPKWTIVDGQIIYICCPPCSKKLAANPEPFLQKLDGYYSASLQAKQARR